MLAFGASVLAAPAAEAAPVPEANPAPTPEAASSLVARTGEYLGGIDMNTACREQWFRFAYAYQVDNSCNAWKCEEYVDYCHYYNIAWDTLEWQLVWPQLLDDARLILEASDVLLSGPTNDEASITPPIVDEDKGIIFSGFADDFHDNFVFYRDTLGFGPFVKTNRKPYDLAVACVLLRAFLLAPECVHLNSDGYWTDEEWIDAVTLYKQLWPDEQIECPWGITRQARYHLTGKADRLIHDGGTAQPVNQSARACVAATAVDEKSCAIHGEIAGLDRAQKWLATCDQDLEHVACGAAPITWLQLPGVSLKVIDVERACIVEAPKHCFFMALTYVWGKINHPKLTSKTAAVLMQEGGLDTIWSDIPMTTRDAILLCRRLKDK
ncbi:uncharacterized protein CC84DRAFT_1216813 [Paraphaeosphaeria sporulosa]|uniref:Uncharacterized protein n=1 Tax=Paraphaeosphaeria sporulosa TaxID=1460663 RepID=A0A177CCU6_9PLEO|nr:uncharacterized protein CC84DRAFT_1216813 [Paraphaeosphaeria sporulosa]OAG05465.1 hypothetical protein CC84DRAFT_1216813 [Paraphaeosphaeria sporulosa]